MLGFRRSYFNKVRLNYQKELLSTFWFQNLVSTEFYGSVVIHFKGLELNLNKCRHRKKYQPVTSQNYWRIYQGIVIFNAGWQKGFVLDMKTCGYNLPCWKNFCYVLAGFKKNFRNIILQTWCMKFWNYKSKQAATATTK